MKRYTILFLLTVLLSVISGQTVLAQAEQDALYIFRNDGNFNAFFYGDIDHIGYSKIDTLGVEHDDYVVQEVYALDSIFRIPLSAIDSVAFVTPETKYKPDVILPDKSIANYIIASDSINWIRLATNTPASLIPKKGDKFLIENASTFIPNGFGGIVTNVENGSNGITVWTETAELTAFYDCLVLKAAATPPAGGDKARRRGILDGDFIDDATVLDFGRLDGKLNIAGSQTIVELLNENYGLSLDGSGTIDFWVTPKVDLRAFLFVDILEGVKSDIFIKAEVDAGLDAKISGALTSHLDIPYVWAGNKTSLIKPFGKDIAGTNKKACEFEFSIGMFIESTGNVELNYNWEGYGGLIEDFNVKEDLFGESYTNRNTIRKALTKKSEYSFGLGSFSTSLGFYVKGDIKFNGPIFKGTHIEFRADLASKTEISMKGTSFSIPSDLYQTWAQDTWSLFDHDECMAFYGYLNGSVSGKINKTTLGPWSRGWEGERLSFALVPEINKIKAEIDEETPYIVKISSPIRREILFPVKVGFAVLRTMDNTVQDYKWLDEEYLDENMSEYWYEFDKLEPGYGYWAVPMVRYGSKSMLVTNISPAYFTLGSPFVEVKRLVEAGFDSGDEHLKVKTNVYNTQFSTKESWLSCFWDDNENDLWVLWEKKPEGMPDRKGTIYITGKDSKGKEVFTDSIIVHQFTPSIELTPNSLEFGAKGGLANVTISMTNLDMKTISVSTNSDYIHAELDGTVITVKVDENTDSESRGGSVFVEGKTPGGQTYKTFVPVAQEASGSEVNPGEVSAAALQFLNTIEEISTLFTVGSWHENDFYVDGEKYISHSYYSGDGRWDNSKGKYDVEDTIMIADINDPEDPHYGMYMISAVHHEVGSNFSWYNNQDRYATIQFFISPTTEDNHGEILDVSIYTKWLETDDPEYYVIKTYNIAKVPYYKTYMRGDGVTNNYRDTEWMADAKRGTLSEGISSYTYSSNSNYENPEYNADVESCSIWIYFKNTIEAPDNDGD